MVREKSRECHNHKPQPFPDPKRKRKPTNLNKHKPNKRTKSTKISSLFPKRGNRNTKRTEKHKNKMTHGKTYNKSPRRINHKATSQRHIVKPQPTGKIFTKRPSLSLRQDRIPETEVLKRAGMQSVHTLLTLAQLRWIDHVTRMPNELLPNKMFCGELQEGRSDTSTPQSRP